MPPGISARALRAGSENTTSRSNRPRKVCVFCRSGCPRRVPGSIPSNPGGCMANGPSLSPTGCFRPSSWLSASVLILAVPMNHICLFPKRSRDYALGCSKRVIEELEGAASAKVPDSLDRRQVLARLLRIPPALLALDWRFMMDHGKPYGDEELAS